MWPYKFLFGYVPYNPHMPKIDAISGTLITLSLSILLNYQCEEGARDGIDIWYMRIKSHVGLTISENAT